MTDYAKLSDAALIRKIAFLEELHEQACEAAQEAVEEAEELAADLALAKHTLNVRELRNRNT